MACSPGNNVRRLSGKQSTGIWGRSGRTSRWDDDGTAWFRPASRRELDGVRIHAIQAFAVHQGFGDLRRRPGIMLLRGWARGQASQPAKGTSRYEGARVAPACSWLVATSRMCPVWLGTAYRIGKYAWLATMCIRAATGGPTVTGGLPRWVVSAADQLGCRALVSGHGPTCCASRLLRCHAALQQ